MALSSDLAPFLDERLLHVAPSRWYDGSGNLLEVGQLALCRVFVVRCGAVRCGAVCCVLADGSLPLARAHRKVVTSPHTPYVPNMVHNIRYMPKMIYIDATECLIYLIWDLYAVIVHFWYIIFLHSNFGIYVSIYSMGGI